MNSVKNLRIKKGMTQEVLASMLGLDKSTVTKWETGKAMPTADKLPELARILGCTIDDLFRTEEKKEVI